MATVTADHVERLFDVHRKHYRHPRIVEWYAENERSVGVVWDGIQPGEPVIDHKTAHGQIATPDQVIGMLGREPIGLIRVRTRTAT